MSDRDISWKFINTLTQPACLVTAQGEIKHANAAYDELRSMSSINELLSKQFLASMIGELDASSLTTTKKVHLIGHGYFELSVGKLDKGVFMLCLNASSEENRFRHLISEAPEAMAIFNLDGRPVYFNKAYGDIWGADTDVSDKAAEQYNLLMDEQLKALGIQNIIEKAIQGEAREIPAVPYNPKRTKSLSTLGLDRNKFVEGHVFPIRNNTGEVTQIGLILHDVTEQKKAEEILTQMQAKFQLLTKNLPGVIYEVEITSDGTSSFKYISDGVLQMFGVTPENALKDLNLVSDKIHPEDQENFHSSTRNSNKDVTVWEWEGRIVVDGKTKWIEGKSTPNAKGNTMLRYGMLLDITEKKLVEIEYHKAMEELQRNEQLFTQLFQNSPIGIVMLDKSYSIMEVNAGFEKMFEYSAAELKGNRLNDLIVPEKLIEEAKSINVLTSNGEVGLLETMRKTKSGKEIPVIIYGVPVRLKASPIGIYGIYVDLTDLKKIENELKVRNEELDNFVYKVSHDLRAPLSSILGLINLAKYEDNQDDFGEYMKFIEERVKQLDHFINDVLSHSKNLKMEVVIGEVNFKTVIEKCIDEFNYLPGAEEIEIKVEAPEEPFYTDVWRVRELMRNLVSNALKYSDPAKPNSYVKVSVTIADNEAIIHVKDNGIGISENNLSLIFDMFYRATEVSQGSGIGLYIVKNAVDKLNGTITVESKIGEGTTFEVRLPAGVPSQTKQQE